MDLSPSAFFEDPDSLMFPELLSSAEHAWDLLGAADGRIERLVAEDVHEVSGELIAHVTVTGPVSIGPGTVIHPGAVIEGPAIIGPDCSIRSDALIRPGTILSRGVVVGHGAEVKHCLVFAEAKLQSLSFVGDSVIGKGARIGSGVITANRRFDQKIVSIRADGERHVLPWAFFGCVLGDYARLGANAVTLPGTVIGPYSWVMPLTSVGGVVPRSSMVRSTLRTEIRPKPEQRLSSGHGEYEHR